MSNGSPVTSSASNISHPNTKDAVPLLGALASSRRMTTQRPLAASLAAVANASRSRRSDSPADIQASIFGGGGQAMGMQAHAYISAGGNAGKW